MFSKILKRISYSLLSGTIVAFPICVTINDYIFSIAHVEGVSMQPTLNPRDRKRTDIIFLNRWPYNEIQRGDVVAMTSPNDRNIRIIKRIVGLEGDLIRTARDNLGYSVIPQGHCWVEGDNIKASLDSNTFGPVPLGLVAGKVTHVVWPPERWKKLDRDIPENRFPLDWNEHMKSVKEKMNNDKDHLQLSIEVDNMEEILAQLDTNLDVANDHS